MASKSHNHLICSQMCNFELSNYKVSRSSLSLLHWVVEGRSAGGVEDPLCVYVHYYMFIQAFWNKSWIEVQRNVSL